jgi:hypothetical protein
VTEKHGWYNDQGKEVIDPRSTLDPMADEGYDSIEYNSLPAKGWNDL